MRERVENDDYELDLSLRSIGTPPIQLFTYPTSSLPRGDLDSFTSFLPYSSSSAALVVSNGAIVSVLVSRVVIIVVVAVVVVVGIEITRQAAYLA
jgi:hypothetical protein